MTNKGFTLIEMLVAIAVFSIFIGAISGVFISGLRLQRESLAYQELLDQTSYAMEYMSRALRMVKKELSAPVCLSQNGLNYEITRGGKGLKFINYQDQCQEFFWDEASNQLKENKTGYPQPLALTADDLEIIVLRFNLLGESQEDNLQPRVTLFWEIKKAAKDQPKIKIQNTISQRNLDVRY